VDHLIPYDQVQFLAYLASRLAQVVPAQLPAPRGSEAADAWEAFFQLGATDTPECETLTKAVLAMRR
jgi:hypothetical protein